MKATVKQKLRQNPQQVLKVIRDRTPEVLPSELLADVAEIAYLTSFTDKTCS